MTTRPRRVRNWLVVTVLTALLLVGAAVVFLRVRFEGPALAETLEGMLNEKIDGRVEIDSIDWPTSSLTTVVTGGWVPLTLKNVQVWDHQNTLLLNVGKITCELDVHALMFGRHDFVLRNVVIDTGNVLLEEIREPLKLHAYDYTIFSLMAAFRGKRTPGASYEVGITAGAPPVFDIRNFEVKNINFTLKLALEGRTEEGEQKAEDRHHLAVAKLESVDGKGMFYTDPHDPLVPKLYFSFGSDDEPITADVADLALLGGKAAGGFDLHFVDFQLSRFAQLPTDWPNDPVANNLEFAMKAIAPDGGVLDLHGAMLDYWDSPYGGTYDIHADVIDGAGIAHEFDPSLGGPDLNIYATVTGPILFPKVGAVLENVEYTVPLTEDEPPLIFSLATASVGLDLATEQGYLEKVVARAMDQQGKSLGSAEVSANFSIAPYMVDAQIAIPEKEPIDLATWLPDGVNEIIGSKIYGTFHARGDAAADASTFEECRAKESACGMLVDNLDLHLGAVHLDRGTILASGDMAKIDINRLHGTAGDTEFGVDGVFRPEPGPHEEEFSLSIDIDSNDLDTWMRRADVTAFAQRARGKNLKVHGMLDDPQASGHIDLGGVEVINDLGVTFAYADSLITIERGDSHTVGDITATGGIRLDDGARAENIRVRGYNVELGKLPGAAGVASGKATLDVRVNGPIGPRLGIDAWLAADEVTVMGQRGTNLRACYNHDPTDVVCQQAVMLDDAEAARCTADARAGGMCVVAGVTRPSGGTAQVWARTDKKGRLAGHADLDALPLDAIAELAGTGKLPAGGTAKLDINLAGTLQAPTANGDLDVFRSWLLDAYVGDQNFKLRAAATDDPGIECGMGANPEPTKPTGPTGLLALCGSLYDGRVVVGAVVATSGKFATRARVDLLRVEVDPFIDLAEMIGSDDPVRAWTSGTITATAELFGTDPPDIQLELSELALLLERVDADGRPAPLVVSAASPLSISTNGESLKLNREVKLTTPAGELTLSGEATPEELALRVSGNLEMKMLEPLLATWVDEADGHLRIEDGRIEGDPANPEIHATLALDHILLRPTRQDAELTIEQASFQLSPKKLDLGSFAIKVEDASSEESAVLTTTGSIDLDRLTPKKWDIQVGGGLAGKLLLAVVPAEISQASGVADVQLRLAGTGEVPEITGSLTFDPSQPFSVMPRGLRRDLILSGGKVEFTKDQITLDDVEGSIDDEGRISRVRGQIDLEDGAPVSGDITLTADGIPFRVPRTLDLVISAEDLQLIWGDDDDGDGAPDMSISGGVEIVQGRFVKNLSFGELVLQPSDSGGGSSAPFWETYPMLGRARLDLAIHAGSLSVVNNIANIELAGEVRLTGTPRTPALEGEIQVQRGTFKPQFTRARFTRTRGSVTFSHFEKFPENTPTVDISSEADYRDSTGQDHLISLSLQGPLSRLTWDLSTSSGLNKSQTLALIVSGKAPADLLRNASDPLGTDPNTIDPSTNPTDGAADQLLKDVAGDFISLLVADPLKDIEILDVARVEVGTGSIGFHGERKVTTNANVVGDVEQTVRGRTINVRMEVQWTNGLTLQLGWLNKNYDDPAEEDVRDREAKVVYRWFLP